MSGTDKEKRKISFNLLILIGFILSAISIAGGGFWLSLQTGTNYELPVLKADKSSFKFKPEEPGGKLIPHQDSLVLELLEGLSENDNQSEKLRLPDAAPELPPVSLQMEYNASGPKRSPEAGPVTDLNDEKRITTSKLAEVNTKELKTVDEQINLTSIIDDNISLQGEVSQYKEAKDATTLSPVEKPDLPKQIVGEKTYKVQLAAFTKQEKAKQQAAILMEKHKNRLDGIMLEVTKIDTGSSGIYWRVITQPINKTLAISKCELLKSAGQDCIVRKIRQDI